MNLGKKVTNFNVADKLKYLIEHDSIEHGGKITKSHSTELAKRLFENGYFKYDIHTTKTTSQQINAVSKTIGKHLSGEANPNTLWLKIYCDYFDCSADYFLGFISTQKHATASTHDMTGLSHDSINALHLMKTSADNKLWHNTELETLNFILENIRRIQQLNNGIGFTDSILNYIGLYLHNGTIHKEPATHVHYKHDNTKWDFLKNGDTVNGNEVQAVEVLADNTNTNINNPDKIPVYDSANDNHYTLDFNKLLESHALNKVTEKLIELKNRYENKE